MGYQLIIKTIYRLQKIFIAILSSIKIPTNLINNQQLLEQIFVLELKVQRHLFKC